MLEITSYTREFPIELLPVGNDTWNKEPFEQWWARNAGNLRNLHPQVAEQWIFRHFSQTPYSSLPIEQLRWRAEQWSAQQIVNQAIIPEGEFNPQFDFDTFGSRDGTSTGRPFLETGTWDYPILTLSTPEGVSLGGTEYPEIRYLLIEGHQRMRMLNAMYVLRKPLQPLHRVYVLDLQP